MSESYQKAINILTSQGKFYINLGLERVQNYLKLIGNPQNKLKFIHVAGTNGKGSVCAMLGCILQGIQKDSKNRLGLQAQQHKSKSSLKIGLYTSPHIYEYTERIKINNQEIPKNIFAKKLSETVKKAEANAIHLTEFEILTIIAFEYFAQNNVDIVILETGLGGRLDATNVIEENLFSIITHIDFDHTERLGSTIEEIAFEKAGIIKPDCPVIVSSKNLGYKIIKKIADTKKSPIITAPSDEINLYENEIPKGIYQKENFALVLSAIEQLNKNGLKITPEVIKKGLKQFKHPCRFEYLKEQNIIIDGAHNPNGIIALRKSLDYYFPKQKFKFIFGCLKNKDYKIMMKNLFTPNDKIYFYHFNNPNSCTIEELKGACDFKSATLDEFNKDDNTLTIICGSFYMIKELSAKMGIK